MVIEVIQNRTPETTMVMIPGTQPRTDSDLWWKRMVSIRPHDGTSRWFEAHHVCAIIARQTWSPQRSQAAFCQDIVRRLISCFESAIEEEED